MRGGAGRPFTGATPRTSCVQIHRRGTELRARRVLQQRLPQPRGQLGAVRGSRLRSARSRTTGSGTRTPTEQRSPHRAPPRGSAPQPRSARTRLRRTRNRTGHRAASVPVPPRTGGFSKTGRDPECRAPGALRGTDGSPSPAHRERPRPPPRSPALTVPRRYVPRRRPRGEPAAAPGGPAAPLRPRRAESGPETAAAPPGTCPPLPEPPGAASPGVGALPPAGGDGRVDGGKNAAWGAEKPLKSSGPFAPCALPSGPSPGAVQRPRSPAAALPCGDGPPAAPAAAAARPGVSAARPRRCLTAGVAAAAAARGRPTPAPPLPPERGVGGDAGGSGRGEREDGGERGSGGMRGVQGPGVCTGVCGVGGAA